MIVEIKNLKGYENPFLKNEWLYELNTAIFKVDNDTNGLDFIQWLKNNEGVRRIIAKDKSIALNRIFDTLLEMNMPRRIEWWNKIHITTHELDTGRIDIIQD